MHLFCIPERTLRDAVFLPLKHPKTLERTLFLFSPTKGLFEFTQLNHTLSKPHSSLLITEDDNSFKCSSTSCRQHSSCSLGEAGVFLATPFNPLWLLGLLLESASGAEPARQKAESTLLVSLLDEKLFSEACDIDASVRSKFKSYLEQHLPYSSLSSQSPTGTDERLFTPDYTVFLRSVIRLATRVTRNGLPKSLERYVASLVELPPISTSYLEKSPLQIESKDDTEDASTVSLSNQILDNRKPTGRVQHLAQIRVVCDYLLYNYAGASLRRRLLAMLDEGSIKDFSIYSKRVLIVEETLKDARGLQAMSENINRKRTHDGDDNSNAEPTKRRQTRMQATTKQASETRATRELKSADLSGMKKLSSFFTRLA